MTGEERDLQHRLVELLGPVWVGGEHRHVDDLARPLRAGRGRRPEQNPAVAERVDQHRGATVGLVGWLAFDRGAVAPGPVGGRVDVIDLQVQGMAECRGGVGRAHRHVGPEVGRLGEHQHGVANADFGVTDRAVRVDVVGAAALAAEDLDVPGQGPAGVGHDEVRRQCWRGQLRLGDILLWHGSSGGDEDLTGQPRPQPRGEVGVRVGWRDRLAQGIERIGHREPSAAS